MICSKCNSETPDNSAFCCLCGAPVRNPKQYVPATARSVGSVFKSQNRAGWVAQIITGYKIPDNPSKRPIPVKISKWGFKTKADAKLWCANYAENKTPEFTLKQVYDSWEKWYSPRIDPSTMAGYRAAFAYFKMLHSDKIKSISAGSLQKCLDDCPKGKRTHQNMKVLAGLLWKYAYSKKWVERVETDTLYTGKGQSKKREALTDAEVERIRDSIGKERYAEYIYALTYLGFRPGELLEIKKSQVIEEDGALYIVEGKKTDAGRERTVPVHQNIEGIIRARLFVPGTDLLFPMYHFSKAKKSVFKDFRQMTDNYFRKFVFAPLMKKLNISEDRVPYSARHTFSNRLKKADGDARDKAALMGHTDYSFTQAAYQTTTREELKTIVDSLK